jgi:MFS family permease
MQSAEIDDRARAPAPAQAAEPSARQLRTVVAASASGTAFEWYDFFVFGSLTSVMSKIFYAEANETAAFIFYLLVFAAGFFVRPLGALVFGHFGDRLGRKGAFIVTITLMGLSTCGIGFLPTFAQAGTWAPIGLVTLRCIQGFALGGEYGGAAIYVAEHAPPGRRGFLTGWIQTSASFGLAAALVVILVTRTLLGEDAFAAWGWRIPFLVSIGLLVISLWIRLRLEESPLFRRIKAEGVISPAPLAESFFRWENLQLVLIALGALMAAQGVIWYTAHFYAQFFLERVLKVEPAKVNEILIIVVAISAPLYVFFGWLSDKVGRKILMASAIGLAALTFFPAFHIITEAANPALARANDSAPVTVVADPSTCALQFDPTGTAEFTTSCDVAKSTLASAGVSYRNKAGPRGAPAIVRIGSIEVASADVEGATAAARKSARTEIQAKIKAALASAGYPESADPAQVNVRRILLVFVWFIVLATALYGPLAAALVELFPTRIRYSALSLPYHIGTGWFGGFLPATSFAIVAATGNVYAGLWYPVIVAGLSFFIALRFLPETRKRSLH